jgi:hypothetical protein
MSEIFAVQLTAAATVALTILALAAAVLAGLAFWRHPRKSGYSSSRTGVRGRAPGSLGRPRVSRRTARRRRPRQRVRPQRQRFPRLRRTDPVLRPGSGDLERGRLSAPDDLGVIMPGETAFGTRQVPADDALKYAILTFRDVAGVRWVRMPDGGLLAAQDPPTASHDSAWFIFALADLVPTHGREFIGLPSVVQHSVAEEEARRRAARADRPKRRARPGAG